MVMLPKTPARQSLLLVAGTVISVGIGVITGLLFDDRSTGLLAGLLSETLTTVVVLWVRVAEIHASVNHDIRSALELSILYEKIAELEDPLFTEKYNQLQWHLRELSEGRYQLHNLHEVYEDDTRSIELMRKDEVLRSICPIAPSDAELEQQIGNKSFVASVRAHMNAASAGVRVLRLYVLPKAELVENALLREHLKELKQSGCAVFYIIHGDHRFRQAETVDLDFLVFGERKVSIGKIDPRSEIVSGATVATDSTTVAKYIRDYNTLLRIAEQF